MQSSISVCSLGWSPKFRLEKFFISRRSSCTVLHTLYLQLCFSPVPMQLSLKKQRPLPSTALMKSV